MFENPNYVQTKTQIIKTRIITIQNPYKTVWKPKLLKPVL